MIPVYVVTDQPKPVPDEEGSLALYGEIVYDCTIPRQPKGGAYTVVSRSSVQSENEFSVDIHLQYTCNSNAKLMGERDLYCMGQTWSGKAPKCNPCGFAGNMSHSSALLPWSAGVYSKSSKPYRHICGGSIIARNVIVSAAHCFWSEEEATLVVASSFAVAAGKAHRDWGDSRDESSAESDVSVIAIPPRFRGGLTNYQDDIALLFLTTPLDYNEYVAPLCVDLDVMLDERQTEAGNMGKVVLVNEGDNASSNFEVKELPYVDIDECITEASPQFRPYITSDKMCARVTNGTSLCTRDSGSGLASPAVDEDRGVMTHYLRGVLVAVPTSDEPCGFSSIATFTDISAHAHFLKFFLDLAEWQPFETRSKSKDPTRKRCILPPYPENGGYVVMDAPAARPGDVFEKVSLIQYTTSGDGQLVEIKNFKCAQGHWSLKIFKYESEKIYLNSSWCRLFQSEPFIEQWTAPVEGQSPENLRSLQANMLGFMVEEPIRKSTMGHVLIYFNNTCCMYKLHVDDKRRNALFFSCLNLLFTNLQPKELCTLPPQPVAGQYTVVNRPSAKPGETYDAVHLIYSCYTKRVLVGNKNVYCFNNVWSGEAPTCLNCGIIRSTANDYAGGIDATLRELPWQVAVYDKGFTPYKQICGGSIIASNLVITAAHCVWNDIEKLRPALRFGVAGGKIYRAWNDPRNDYVQKSDVSEIKIPPRFRGSQTNFQDDVALLFLTTPFYYNEFVLPICMDFDPKFDAKQLTPGKFGKVAGWGLISEDGRETQKLQTGWLPNVDVNRCIIEAPPDFRVYITSDKICAGYTNGSALCKGDSGGGIAFPEGPGREPVFYLRGIISIAPTSDKACNVYAVTSFTQLLAHQYFIKENLDKALF
ncbi:Modular serine protease [Eumeta japonica]|uniref:Modular serine protease n=1 Tax=Eumeta variegata TaxID=151549 RepID=A0A4C1V3A4_EUMVA|nr:Modular serine protease [Eumeta japonica]